MDIRIKQLGLKVIHSKAPSSERTEKNFKDEKCKNCKAPALFASIKHWGVISNVLSQKKLFSNCKNKHENNQIYLTTLKNAVLKTVLTIVFYLQWYIFYNMYKLSNLSQCDTKSIILTS